MQFQKALLPLLTLLAELSESKLLCRCRPSEPCWPSETEWAQLNKTTHGRLHSQQPVGAVCHDGSSFDPKACAAAAENQYNSAWRSDHTAAVEWPNWEAWPQENQSCYIDTPKSIPCGQGRVSLYSIRAVSPEHVQAGVLFAKTHNLRLAIRNTGHDFAGKSVAPDSLQINTHWMTDKMLHRVFQPTGCTKNPEGGLAVTLGAGVQLYDMYKWLGERNIMVVGGSSHGVGIAGGYIQGGGHSPLSAIGGMASDNALEFTVVTSDGSHITANACRNSDLFWALRGGGGGTWGVVTSVTVRAFKDPPIVAFSLTGQTLFGDESYWEAVERFHAFLPTFNRAGGNMYYWLYPDIPGTGRGGRMSGLEVSGSFANTSDKAAADKVMAELVTDLQDITGVLFNYTSTVSPSAAKYLASVNSQPDAVGQRVILGSRLVTRDFLLSKEGPRKVTAALRSLRTYPANTLEGQNAIQGLVVAGPAVWANEGKVDSALHSIWRKVLLHIVLARGWPADASIADQQAIQRNLTQVEVPILKSIDPAPGGGTYLNEADGYEEGFQDSFWGSNYARLYALKQKWDPGNLFIVRRGAGSEDWDAEGLCRLNVQG